MESKTYKDYYYILGVAPDATTQQIRDAYNDLYTRFGPHASVQGHDPAIMIKTFKDIEEAYQTLVDPAKRKTYDENNLPHLQKSQLRQLWSKLSGVDTSSIPMMQTGSHQRGEPNETRIELEVTLKEAIKGATKQVKIGDQVPCNQCAGMKPMARMQCPNCRGTGSIPTERTEEFNLTGGLYEKMEVRFRGRGKFDMRAGISGDLVVEVKIKPHPFFELQGKDIACTVPITLYEAVLGAEVEVPTASGRVIMNVRPLTQHGRVYRLKGLGLAGGDLLVTVEIELPTQISGEEVALFRKLKDLAPQPNPRTSIFNKLSQGP